MKLLVLSDLHLERNPFELRFSRPNFDAVILAGDIHTPGHKAVPWARKTFGTSTPVFFVPGNHEHYYQDIDESIQAIRNEAAGTNVHFLDRDSVTIGGVRFLGCTLWTDFSLPFRLTPDEPILEDVVTATARAQRGMFDFEAIQHGGGLWRAAQSREQHMVDRAWLLNQFTQAFNGTTVVATHHTPCVRSVPQRWLHRPIAPAFCTDLPGNFFGKASLWVHGHQHDPADYNHLGTRILCNPRGHLMKDGAHENIYFDPHLVAEV